MEQSNSGKSKACHRCFRSLSMIQFFEFFDNGFRKHLAVYFSGFHTPVTEQFLYSCNTHPLI